MRKLITLLVFAIMIETAVTAEIGLGDAIQIDLPPGWSLQAEDNEHHFIITNPDLGAEILIFDNVLRPEETILNQEDLRLSVENVAADILLDLPEARLISTSGYFENERVRFVLEFISRDTTLAMNLWHRFAGYIYNHPDGHQLLFTIWGKAPLTNRKAVEIPFEAVQGSFRYDGPTTASFFSDERPTFYWYIGAFLTLLLVLLFVRRRRVGSDTVPFAENELVWRCTCGRLNHRRSETCRRCGKSVEIGNLT